MRTTEYGPLAVGGGRLARARPLVCSSSRSPSSRSAELRWRDPRWWNYLRRRQVIEHKCRFADSRPLIRCIYCLLVRLVRRVTSSPRCDGTSYLIGVRGLTALGRQVALAPEDPRFRNGNVPPALGQAADLLLSLGRSNTTWVHNGSSLHRKAPSGEGSL